MEHITRQQTVLIALLVAIVTSVATAISVVSLTDPTVSPTQTIYRVIETSIEKVADLPTQTTPTPTVDSPKTPTFLSPSDIAQIGSKSIVRIFDTSNNRKQFVALGIVVGSKNGVVASSLASGPTESSTYVAVGENGKDIPATLVKNAVAGSYTFFTLAYPDTKSKIPSIPLVGIGNLKLGANVVAIGGKESGNLVSTGIVSELQSLSSDPTSGTPNVVITDMSLTSSLSGFLLFDTSGSLLALEEPQGSDVKKPLFLNAVLIKNSLAGLL